MFLRSVTLENVRAIEHLEMSFEAASPGDARRWSFLLGENGTGKSTFLRAIALLLAGSDGIADLIADPSDWVRFGANHASISADLSTSDDKARHVELHISRGQNLREVYDANRDTLEELDRALEHTSRSYLVIGYGVSRRAARDTGPMTKGESGLHPRARAVATLFDADARLNPIERWAMDLDYRKGAEGLAMVRDAVSRVIPGVRFAHIDKDERELMFETADGTVPFRLLSDGYRTMVAWFGDLLFQLSEIFSDYERPLDARGLLLVDELELHLHPVWQRRLVDSLTKLLPNFQFMVTTHSPITAHQAGEGELFVLQRPETTSPPELQTYAGAPRDLLIHQLVASPMFGLDSLHSHDVEQMREAYRVLRDKKSLSETEQKQLAKLREALKEVPEPTGRYERDPDVVELLRDIDAELKKKDGQP